MWTCSRTPPNSQLYHHGIKGQKWGVRNGPPYPLNHTNSSKSSGANEKKTTASSSGSPKSYVRSHMKQTVRQCKTGASEEAIEYAIATVSAIGVMALSSVIASRIDHKKEERKLEDRRANRKIKSFDTAPKLKKKMEPSESMKHTNPDFPSVGTTMNCTSCTTAMALREKGYDVKSIKMDTGTYSNMLFKKAFNSPEVKMKRRQTAESMLQELKSNGEGSYGNLRVTWAIGGGHSIFWKVENGKTRIYDAQSGEEYTSSDKMMKQFAASINRNNIVYNRLDNCTPTEYALAMVEPAQEDRR